MLALSQWAERKDAALSVRLGCLMGWVDHDMLIAIAGPYSADTPEKREHNFAALNKAAAAVFNLGHIPVIGVNAALPIVECLGADVDHYEIMMTISLALVDRCDAILMLGESKGANRELEVVRSKGLPVYLSVDEIPAES